MLEFLSRRLAAALVTLALATVVVFAVVEVLPGDPALVMLGTDARPDTLAAIRAKYGFDQPLLTRYLQWIGGLLTFNLGNSHAYGTSVSKLIGDRLVVTLPLGAMALSWATLVAIPLGVFAAWKHRRPGDWGVMGFTQIGISVPNFWFGIVLVLASAVPGRWSPAGGFPGWQEPLKSVHALILPALSLSLGEIAILTRVTRSAMLDTLREDYVRTARAKGASERVVLFRHALRTALIPVLWTPHPIDALNMRTKLMPSSAAYPLGTDHLGRDVLSRIMVGAQTSITVGLIAVAIGLTIGVALGAWAAAHGGWVDEALSRTSDLIFAFPAVLIAILITSVLGASAQNAILAIAIFNIPVFARVTRGAALAMWSRDFIRAATAMGQGPVGITLRHVLPNIASVLIVQATIQFAVAILAEAGLSYLGLGAQPYIFQAPELAVWPGLAIALAVLGLNMLGDGLRDLLDPRLRLLRVG